MYLFINSKATSNVIYTCSKVEFSVPFSLPVTLVVLLATLLRLNFLVIKIKSEALAFNLLLANVLKIPLGLSVAPLIFCNL